MGNLAVILFTSGFGISLTSKTSCDPTMSWKNHCTRWSEPLKDLTLKSAGDFFSEKLLRQRPSRSADSIVVIVDRSCISFAYALHVYSYRFQSRLTKCKRASHVPLSSELADIYRG